MCYVSSIISLTLQIYCWWGDGYNTRLISGGFDFKTGNSLKKPYLNISLNTGPWKINEQLKCNWYITTERLNQKWTIIMKWNVTNVAWVRFPCASLRLPLPPLFPSGDTVAFSPSPLVTLARYEGMKRKCEKQVLILHVCLYKCVYVCLTVGIEI